MSTKKKPVTTTPKVQMPIHSPAQMQQMMQGGTPAITQIFNQHQKQNTKKK